MVDNSDQNQRDSLECMILAGVSAVKESWENLRHNSPGMYEGNIPYIFSESAQRALFNGVIKFFSDWGVIR